MTHPSHSDTPLLASKVPQSVGSITLDLDRDEAIAVLVALEVRRLSRRGTVALRAAGRRVELKVAAIVNELTDA